MDARHTCPHNRTEAHCFDCHADYVAELRTIPVQSLSAELLRVIVACSLFCVAMAGFVVSMGAGQ